MSTALTSASENELFEVIFQRLDEAKKIWKTLKNSLSESFLAFDHYGKVVLKGAKQVSLASTTDPSLYCSLTSHLLEWEEKLSQQISERSQSCCGQLMKTFDEYGEKLDSTSSALNESAQSVIKQIATSRQNYSKEKIKYEKICKEMEALMTEKNKMTNDPLVFYSISQQKRIRARIFYKLQELRQCENTLQEITELMNGNQSNINNVLGDVLKTFRVALRTTLTNTIEAVRVFNKSLTDLFEKGVEDSTSMVKPGENGKSEEEYILEQMSMDDTKKKEIAANLMITGSRELFSEIHKSLLANPFELTDDQIHIYVELLQKRFDVSLAMHEERRKMVKLAKGFMQELANHCDMIAKQLQKASKNPFHFSPAFSFSKRINVLLDPFYNGLGNLGKKFHNFGTFITMKLNVIEGIITDQRNSLKTYQTQMQKAIKDHMSLRAMIETNWQSQEKLQKKIDETPSSDPKWAKFKKDLETLMVQQIEQRGDFRKHAIETAKNVTKIETEHKKQENSKHQSFRNTVEGILGQESCLFMEICLLLKQTNEAIRLENGIEHEIMLVVGQDEKLADCLKYVESKKGNIVLAFQKIYTPPAEYTLEYEKGQIGKLGWITPEDFIQFDDLQGKKDDDLESNDEEEEDTKETGEITSADKASPGKIEKKFQINTNDKLLGDFTCAVYQKVLRHGWMYVYSNSLCFHSSKIFGDSVLKIPIKDIIKAEKKVISLVFDSALTIVTKYGEIVFTSFFSRDKAWSLIERLRKGEIDLTEVAGDNTSPVAAKIPKSADFEMKKPGLGEELKNSPPTGNPIKEEEEDANVMRKLNLMDDDEEKEKNGRRRKTISVTVSPRNGIEFGKAEKGSATPKGNRSPFFEALKAEIEATNAPTVIKEEPSQVVPLETNKSDEVQVEVKKVDATQDSAEKIKGLKQELEARRKTQFGGDFKIIDSCSQIVGKDTFDCSCVEFYRLIFSDEQSENQGKKFKNFLTWSKQSNGDTDITNTQWNASPPNLGADEVKTEEESLRELLKSNGKSSRIFNYTHPVKEQSMFVPKSCPIEEKQTILWLSMDEIIIYSESRSFKVPMSDCFVVRNSFTLKNLEANKCELTWKLGIDFVKSTMFKGKITKSVQDENLEIAQKVIPLMKSKVSQYKNAKKPKEIEVKEKVEFEERKQEENKNEIKTEKINENIQPIVDEVKESQSQEINKSQETEISSGNLKVENIEGNKGLETILREFKTSQEKMNGEIKSLKSWIILLALMNLFVLSLLFFR